MYTSLSPCDMCTGACVLFGVARVVIGENQTFVGGEQLLKEKGIEVVVLQNEECYSLMQKFIREKPQLWYSLFQNSSRHIAVADASQGRGHSRLRLAGVPQRLSWVVPATSSHLDQ